MAELNLDDEVKKIETERELAERLHGYWLAQRSPFEQVILRAKSWHVVVTVLLLVGLGGAVASRKESTAGAENGPGYEQRQTQALEKAIEKALQAKCR
jgi:hypothetical protein